ncbi:MAG: glycerol-3-phosphate 1-O-acyltransferase PlsY [Enterovibrio sp.]
MSATELLFIIIAYLMGSISSAVLLCQLFHLPDPRKTASCNPGTTNVFRIGGRYIATLVLFFDMLKGMIPVWCAYLIDVSPFFLGMIGVSACLGHIYPIFFHFQGGKGVATALGAIAPIGFDLTGMMVAAWLITVMISGYSSLGALVPALIAPLFTWFIKPQFTLPVAMLSCLIIFRHQENIKRLLSGTERRIYPKRSLK